MATCARVRCEQPASDQQIVLVGPDGTDRKRCGPYCAEHTFLLRQNLTPTYTGTGDPTYRIDVLEPA